MADQHDGGHMATILDYWPVIAGAVAAILYVTRVEGGMLWNRRKIGDIEKQREEDLRRLERQRQEDLATARESREGVREILRVIQSDIKHILERLP